MLTKCLTLYAKKKMQKPNAKYCMPKNKCQNRMLKKCKHQVYQHTAKVMRYRKTTISELQKISLSKCLDRETCVTIMSRLLIRRGQLQTGPASFRARRGGHRGLRYYGIGLFSVRYFGNFNFNVRYCGII